MFQRFFNFLQLDKKFLLFVFLFSYFLVVTNRIKVAGISWYSFTPEGPIFQFVFALVVFSLVRYWLNSFDAEAKTKLNFIQYSWLTLKTLGLYLLLRNIVAFIFALAFNTLERNFNSQVLLADNLSSVVDVLLFTSIYLTYFHYQQLNNYRKLLDEMRIQQLKAQLNPHFTFNSLNTLDELIHSNPDLASEYLNDFADLYRLSLQSADKKLVFVATELNFAQYYFRLMQSRLGEGYQLEINNNQRLAEGLIPPFTLQLLLENVFCHNYASAQQPLLIQIVLNNKVIDISNPIQLKPKPTKGNGIGLGNLSRQLQLLTGHDLQITQTSQTFRVRIPIVNGSAHV